jgi:hypothetical protein
VQQTPPHGTSVASMDVALLSVTQRSVKCVVEESVHLSSKENRLRWFIRPRFARTLADSPGMMVRPNLP